MVDGNIVSAENVLEPQTTACERVGIKAAPENNAGGIYF